MRESHFSSKVDILREGCSDSICFVTVIPVTCLVAEGLCEASACLQLPFIQQTQAHHASACDIWKQVSYGSVLIL